MFPAHVKHVGSILLVVSFLGACDTSPTDTLGPAPMPEAATEGAADGALGVPGEDVGDFELVAGPFAVERNRGKPRLDVFAVDLEASVGAYVLRVSNGRGDPARHATGGRVWVDDVLVLDIEDSGDFEDLMIPLGSDPVGSISVRLTGKPGTGVDLSILEEGGGSGMPGFVTIATWQNHTCALDGGGHAWCWGSASDGSVGDGGGSTFQTTPVPVVGGLTFSELTLGFGFTCGLATNQTAYCWGRNEYGQLGNGSTTWSSSPVAVVGGLAFAHLDAGTAHACGVTAAGAAYCWGQNLNGGLGDGTNTQSTSPVLVAGGLTFESISSGDTYSCGVEAGGHAYCWGGGAFGNGSGVWTVSGTPVQAAQGSGLLFDRVEVGAEHACGLTQAALLYCWGSNGGGAIGDGSFSYAWTPQLVSGGFEYASVSAGRQSTCAVTLSNEGLCWGVNDQGQVGIGTTSPYERTPQATVLPSSVHSISAGNGLACAALADGTAYCWGNNDVYQGGTGATGDHSLPTLVTAPTG